MDADSFLSLMSVQLQSDSFDGIPIEPSKSTDEMIMDEKEQIDLKLLKEDGYKAMEIGTSGVVMRTWDGFR